MRTENLFKLIRAIEHQLGGVPEWRKLIDAARKEMAAIERTRWLEVQEQNANEEQG